MDISTIKLVLVPGILSLGGAILAIVGATANHAPSRPIVSRALLGVIGLLVLALASWALVLWPQAYPAGLAKLTGDPLAQYTTIIALGGAILSLLVALNQPRLSVSGEFLAMLLFTTVGLIMVGLAADLIVLLLAVELSSVPSYVLVGLSRRSSLTEEAAAKYFFLGALAAAILAYGFILLYGAAGTMTITTAMAASSTPTASWLAAIGLALAFTALAFKITAVPFYFYTPDVYQGTAGRATAIIAFLPKVAGFIALLRILAFIGFQSPLWHVFWPVLWVAAAATVTVGNILALIQTDVKRLLAYSSIAHSGYMLIALAAVVVNPGGLQNGLAAVLFYVLIYGLMSLGAFGLLGYLRRNARDDEPTDLRDLAGLARRQPGLSLLLAVFLLSLTGLPPTGGFWAKVYVFTSALAAGNFWLNVLVILGLVNAAVGAAYYFRILSWIYIHPDRDAPTLRPADSDASTRAFAPFGLVLTAVVLLLFGLLPQKLMHLCEIAAAVLK